MRIKNRFTGGLILEIESLYNADLSHADLYNADLSRADLSRANLSHANLYNADLSRADLSRANLSHADLLGADLSRANLSRADLLGANLLGANLSRADLSHADLSRANLYGANLYGAKGIACAGPLGSRGDFVFANSGHDTADGLMWKAGCRWCATPELVAAVHAAHDNGQYAIEYLTAMAFIKARLGVTEKAAEAESEKGD